jgi:hypothetical protein
MRRSMSAISALKVPSAALAVAAVVLSASEARSQQLFEYAVKFVCNRALATPAGPPPVAPGYYYTDINVHNPSTVQVDIKKRFAQALPNQKAGKISPFFGGSLKPDEAFTVECAEITKDLGFAAGTFVTGFAMFQTSRELDIVAVYTAAASQTGTVVTMYAERVPKRP